MVFDYVTTPANWPAWRPASVLTLPPTFIQLRLESAAAVTMRLLVESGMPLAGGIVGAGGELEWPNPAR
jgi:hypothetical protein